MIQHLKANRLQEGMSGKKIALTNDFQQAGGKVLSAFATRSGSSCGQYCRPAQSCNTGDTETDEGTDVFSRAFFSNLKNAVTFITSLSRSINMHNIVSSKKMENGIVVFWDEKDEKKYESFNYSELIDMKVNALDLLERPKSYKIDKDAHTLVSKK
jgi:hypothetical protein